MASRRYQAEEIDQFSRLLVHEYMSNVSSLTFGVVIRLMHFQKECSTQIIHCDIKPRNILLDRLSRLGFQILNKQSCCLLIKLKLLLGGGGIRGTICYFASKWFRKGTITAKVDVYNFGGMSLEILSCKGRRRGCTSGWSL